MYLLAMERSPIRDIEIKYVLKNALTDQTDSREVYMKGVNHSYYYEGAVRRWHTLCTDCSETEIWELLCSGVIRRYQVRGKRPNKNSLS